MSYLYVCLLGYANSPEEGGSSARKMARDTAGGLDLSFKHTTGGDLDEDDEDETTGTRDEHEDDQDEEPNQTSAAAGDEPAQRGSVSGTAARRRKPLAPQWVNPDWTTEPAADGAPAAQPEGIAAQRLNRSWEDRQQDEKEGDSRTINGVCVMMNPAAFCGQSAAAAEAAGRVWVARNMED
jgi:hypothetical protein